ncbi:hypothetical protein [Archangium violaceum]|uniref:hypothetical protein n=1 Tax=Archangium violaceum TaxID=83451 RepID=UPI001EF03B13|nr:hypothetical protein [Archangium violaceum]
MSGGPFKLRYDTTSSADASLLALLVVRIQLEGTDAGSTTPDAGTTDAGTVPSVP